MIVRPARTCLCRSRGHVDAGPAGAFVLGFGSAFVVSPCCTPIIAAVGSTLASPDGPRFGILCLAIFGVSHAAPLVLSGTVGRYLPRLPATPTSAVAASVISGALLLALSAYYGLLA
jgi:cytochrome c biogenesis protein CcdA